MTGPVSWPTTPARSPRPGSTSTSSTSPPARASCSGRPTWTACAPPSASRRRSSPEPPSAPGGHGGHNATVGQDLRSPLVERIGVFPGSFDPLTTAHLAIADAAIEVCGLDRLDLTISHAALAKEPGGHAPIEE